MLFKSTTGNGIPENGGGAKSWSLFSLTGLTLLLVSLATVLMVNRVEPLRRIVKPKA